MFEKKESTKTYKCRVCGAPASCQNTILFSVENGFGWMIDRVHLCDNHAENLDSNEMDTIYIKSRLSHLSRTRLKKKANEISSRINQDKKPKT